MSTQIFISFGRTRTYGTGNNDAKLDGTTSRWGSGELATTRGGGNVGLNGTTVTGPTSGIEVTSAGTPIAGYTDPLDADVTISGSITWNLWALESSMSANVAINARLEVIDGATGAITLIHQTARTVELGTTAAVQNFAETPAAGVLCKRGDRLRLRIFGKDSAAATMASGFTFTFDSGAGTAGNDGDSYFTLTENVTFAAEPAGSQVFLTDTSALGETVTDTGFIAPGTSENLDRGGLAAWSNPGNAAASDDVYATAVNVSGTNYLVCRNFGLSIPTGSVIRGVVVELEGNATNGDFIDLQLQDSSAALVGASQPVVTIPTGSADTVVTAGGQDDSWSAALTKAIVESANFGVRAWSRSSEGGATTSIDRIRVKVYYQTAGVYKNREAWTSRDVSVQTDVTNTAAGWTSPIQMTDVAAGVPIEWYTRRLAAMTLGSAVRCNIRALESTASANAAIRVEIAVVDFDGSNAVVWAAGTLQTELPTSDTAQSFLISGKGLAVTSGQRLRIRVYIDDAESAGAMGVTDTVTMSYGATIPSIAGDTYLTFTQTLVEGTFAPPFTRRDLANLRPLRADAIGYGFA